MIILFKFSKNFSPKYDRNSFLTDNHHRTIYESVRAGCSSCMLMMMMEDHWVVIREREPGSTNQRSVEIGDIHGAIGGGGGGLVIT